MAAAPDAEFLGQGGFLSDADQFSPSVFLDLPPTPRLDGDGVGVDPASPESDDLVLPYISRMLMEEGIDDQFFYQYPDHPALLQAQQPFAQILSDTTTDATTCSGSAATVSPSTSADGAPDDASPNWSYDPIELSELLRSPPYPDTGLDGFSAGDANAFFLPAQDGAREGFQESSSQLGRAGDTSAFFDGHYGGSTGVHTSAFSNDADQEQRKTDSITLPAADGDHEVLAPAFLCGQTGVNMEMLNLAFRKGMEEANKFLPTSNSLLIDLEAKSEEHQPRDSKLSRGFVTGQVKKDGAMLMFQGSGNGRGRKNRHDRDDLDAEIGRKGKLMVPEPEETGEMVDDIILNGRALCIQEMEGLRITMGSEAEKNIRRGNGRSAQGRQNTNGVVDFSTLLIHCAQAVASGDRRSATELLSQIKRHSSQRGDADQRLAHCFAEGLEARLAGMGSQVYKSLVAKRTSLMEYLKAYKLYLAACCFKIMAFKFSNTNIIKAISGRKKVHIVDYGVNLGFQWPSLLGFLATREGGPPEVRITGIDLPQPGFHPAARIEETGRRLSNCARQFKVPFKFHTITAKWETVCVDDLNIDPDEVLIVNSINRFGNLSNEAVDTDSPSPRDVVLSNIRKMRPDVFILFVMNGLYSSPFFVSRFREALFHYSAMFDMLDATAPRDSDQRLLVEQNLFGQCALNVIACEGSDRVECPETYRQWQVRNHRAGLRQLPLDLDIVKLLRESVKSQFHKDFVIDMDRQWLLQGWKGRILYAMSTWVADGAISES